MPRTPRAALQITDPDLAELTRRLATLTGQSVNEALLGAVKAELARREAVRLRRPLLDRVKRITSRCAARPDLRTGTPDEIIGFDRNGLVT